MPDNIKKKPPAEKPIKVAEDVKRAIEDEARILSRTEQIRVTEGDVVYRLWKAYKDLSETEGREPSPAQKLAKSVPTAYSFPSAISDTLSLEEVKWIEGLVRLGLEHLRRAPGADSGQSNSINPVAPDTGHLLKVAGVKMDQAERDAEQALAAAKELRRAGGDDKSDRRGTRKRIK